MEIRRQFRIRKANRLFDSGSAGRLVPRDLNANNRLNKNLVPIRNCLPGG